MDVTENIDKLIRKLEVASIFQQLPDGLQSDNRVDFDDREINSLAGYSSILSLSDDPNDISLSYEIITRLIEYTHGDCSRVISAADLVFSRIGNFPSRTLLRDRHVDSTVASISPSLKLECIAREAENTIYMDEARFRFWGFFIKREVDCPKARVNWGEAGGQCCDVYSASSTTQQHQHHK